MVRSFVLTAFSFCTMFVPAAVAQDTKHSNFRVDTDVYFDLKKEPVSQSLTLFKEGVCYDFGSEATGVVTIIDPQRQRVILLDQKRKVRTQVEFAKLKREIDDAASQAPAGMTEVSVRKWDETAEGVMATVGNQDFTYISTVVTPPEADIAQQYAAFTNWSARLNAVYPPNLPPYLRMELNNTIAERNAFPKKITRTAKQQTVYSIASPIWRLSQDDETRIQSVGNMLAQFEEVDASRFWAKSPAKTARN